MQIACAWASASIACSIDMDHSCASIVLVIMLRKVRPGRDPLGRAHRFASSSSASTTRLKKPQRRPLPPLIERPSVEQFRRPALADDPGQDRAGPHVAACKADAVNRNAVFASGVANPQVRAMAMIAPAPTQTPSMAAITGLPQLTSP
jgi:hypothetical protein